MKITFLGGGNMANAMIGGLVKTGFSAADIAVIELGAQGRAKLRLMYGDTLLRGADGGAALDCDAVLLSVKPQQMHDACEPLAPPSASSSN
jgi:pyrroline-5-carboxylate reductase